MIESEGRRAADKLLNAQLDAINAQSDTINTELENDSPNQQAQDKDSLTRILTFIAENQPEGTQLILGLENDMGLTFGGKLIATPSNKYHLLQEDQYESVHDEVFGLLKNSLKS